MGQQLNLQAILILKVREKCSVDKSCVSTEGQILAHGYPAYTMSCAWLVYSDDTLKQVGI